VNNFYKKLIFDSFKKHAPQVLLILFLVVLAKITVIGLPFLLKLIVDEIPEYQSHRLEGELIYLPLLAIAYASFFLSTTLFDESKEYLSEKLIQPIVAKVGANAFDKLINLPDDYLISKKSGAVMRDIDRGLKGLQSLSTIFIHTIIPTFFELLFVSVFCFFTYDIWISATIVIGILIHGLITLVGSETLSKEKIKLNEVDSASAALLGEAVNNSETIKLFSAEDYESEKFLGALNAYSSQAIRFQFLHSRLRAVQQTVIAVVLGILLVRASFLAMNNLMTAGQFVLLVALAMQVLLPVSFLGSIWKEAMRLLADVSKLSELLEAPSTSYNVPTTPKEIAEVPPTVSFNNVTFAYGDDENFLSDITFSIPSGGVTALVGASGSGKTTITRLLLGFVDQKSGEIRFNGNTTTQQERRLYRRHVGVVPQNVTLFHGTIASNIAYGKRSASMSEIEAAAKLAQIDGFITTLPKGYSTQVGERGLKLSGGQRQMLGIARALINNPKLLILDEASSALDSLSESRFIESALTARQGRTCIVIAHRLSMVTQADLILVLDKGAIIESGTHISLLEKKGKYAALWAAQSNN